MALVEICLGDREIMKDDFHYGVTEEGGDFVEVFTGFVFEKGGSMTEGMDVFVGGIDAGFIKVFF